jgi:hypothetical protein
MSYFWFMLGVCLHGLLLDPEDGVSMFLHNFGKTTPDFIFKYDLITLTILHVELVSEQQ